MKFFSYDGDSDLQWHATEEEAIANADKYLESYREEANGDDDGWLESVEAVCWGEVTQMAQKVDAHKPNPEEGEDTRFEEICDYELQDVK